mmetsp:Transcript_1342/g.848  ORF Transcript_1342/g.848 Transcript_1342/m.848 type:complete len:167 (-) Transcript_1342:507-1007(-)
MQAIYIWSISKFQNRLMMMRELVNSYQEGADINSLSPADDPFIDQTEPLLIGQAFCLLKPVAYLLDNPCTISIVSETSDINGKLEVNIIPTDSNGDIDIPDELIPDEPKDLIGQRIDFQVHIIRAYDLPEDFCRDVYVEYSFYIDHTKYRTPVIGGKNRRPNFEFQ